ncbi:MAG: glycogen/starch synthase [Bacteroidetes bacterium]|nr:glycogen/starch synthase [Rhodothermia bacterium]MCS7155095.1 glycogen/starch synthase [Bacteroidota bacterium]MCX7907201.1 glycogen/starch synthase [Bacteroidota bacterium]MDW8138728.1 glycogen/starch synthase [Bacteroidota bacterium]MDW8286063.1 glycogen/starch synthase [Bacteroidota bacterium]
MRKSLRVLFAAGEMTPFAKLTDAADLIRSLPEALQLQGHEIRIMLPKYGFISDRRNRLHEVIRLSSIEVPVGDRTEMLKVKVASIPSARLQVYFLDNERYFKRRGILADEQTGEPFPDNDERAIFFSRGVLETIRRLGWCPDIIHCHDWMASLIPVYLKTLYRHDPLFAHTKTIYTVHNWDLPTQFPKQMLLSKIGLPEEELERAPLAQNGHVDLLHGGLLYADAVSTTAPHLDPATLPLSRAIAVEGPIEHMVDVYAELYRKLAS